MAKSPFYKILYKENNVDITDKVSKIRFEDCVNEDNLLVIDIDHADNDFIDEVSSMKGDMLIFQYGFLQGAKTGNRLAEIKSIEVTYSDETKLKIKCHDSGFAIKKQISNRIYEDMTASDIVAYIAKEFGFEAEIQDTTEAYTIPQGNKTYFEFIKRLAQKEGLDFFITDNIIKFKSRDLSKEAKKLFEFGDGKEVLSFKPKYEDKGSSNKVSSAGIDSDTGNAFSLFTKPEGMKESGLAKRLIKFDINGNRLNTPSESGSTKVTPETNQNLIKKQTDKEVEDSILSNMTATLQIELDTTVEVEDIITMSGVAKEHAGNWYVHKKTDVLNQSGGITTLELARNATNNNNGGDGSPGKVNKSEGKKEAGSTKQVKIRKFDINGNQIN